MPNQTTAGWIVFLAAISMFVGLLAVDVMGIMNWDEVGKPAFVGAELGHLAAVITAFVAGKIIPTQRTSFMERASDPKSPEVNP